jgi:hypothetical protein
VILQGVFSSLKRQEAGGGVEEVQVASTHLLPVSQQRRQVFFAKSPLALQKAPWLWGVFQGKNKTAQILYKSIIGICLKLRKTSGAFLLISKTLNYFYLTL